VKAWRFLPLCPDDLDAVTIIENQSFGDPWERSSIKEELENLHSRAFILLNDKNGTRRDVGAYIFLRIVMDEAQILKLATAPDWRRRGLAAYLVNEVLYEVGREGCCRVLLEVRTSNLAAIRLYKSLGFETIGERTGYYRPIDGNALVMAKNIEETS
jgi:ribosomal-protein-alanine N-acetyltransferase